MSESPLTILHWVSWDDVENDPSINERFTEAHKEVLIKYLREHKITNGGFWHQSSEGAGVPVFSDGVVGLFSLRSWGGIVYESTLLPDEPFDPFGYCHYAWSS